MNEEQEEIKEKQESYQEEEEELNSNDDVSEFDQHVDPGKNILLAYYDTYSRKRDRRRMVLKHCVLRFEEMDWIFPLAKGDFLWVAERRSD